MDMNYTHLFQTPFLIRPSPYPQESPMGYLLRVAEDNGWSSHESLIRQTPATPAGKPTYIWHIATNSMRMQEIERLLSKPLNTVAGLTYDNVTQGRVSWRYFRHVILPADMFEFGAARYCPECLSSSPYRRDLWDLAPLQSCTEHGLLLQQDCPHCGAKQRWTKTWTTTCGTCLKSLIDAPRKNASPGLQWLSNMTVSMLSGSTIPESANRFPGNVTDFMEVVRLLTLFVSGEGCRGRDLPALPTLTPDTARQVYETVAIALQNWPYSAPEVVRAQIAKQWQQYPALGPQSWEKRAHRILSRGSYIAPRFSPWVTPLHDALAMPQTIDMKQLGKLATKDINCTKALVTDQLSLQEAAKLLGVSAKTMRLPRTQEILGDLGLLSQKGSLKSLDSKQLDSLFETLHSAVRKRHTAKTITLSKTQTTLLGRHGRDVWDIVQAVTRGELIPVNWLRGTPLSAIEFDQKEVIRYLEKDKSVDSDYTIPDAARKLKCLTDALRSVIKVGLLKAPKVRCADGHQRQMVSIKALERFNSCYVFSATLAKEVGVEPRRFAEKLMDEGVKPASRPGIDGGLVYVFRRKDLKNIDLHAVAQKTDYKKRCGRKTRRNAAKLSQLLVEKDLLTSQEVAILLKTSIQQVSKLIKQGHLKNYDHAGKLGNKHYFRRSDIEHYIAAYRDNPALMLEAKAAEQLGISLARFRAAMIRSRRIELVTDGMYRYVWRNKLLAVANGFEKHPSQVPHLTLAAE